HRGRGWGRRLAPLATEVPGARCTPVRCLHAWIHRRRQGNAGKEAETHRGGRAPLAGRQSLSLHGLRQDRPRGVRRREVRDDPRIPRIDTNDYSPFVTIRAMRGSLYESIPMSTTYKVIGTRPIRHDGMDKVTGRAVYGADVQIAGLLHGRVLRSSIAHGRIRKIDVSKAAALPGVEAVVTSADFPETGGKIAELGEGAIIVRHLSSN